MSLLVGDPLTGLAFSMQENKGVFAVLIGSGLSRSADIPTGWEITMDLVRRVALAQGESEQPNWEKWYSDKTGKEPNYSSLLEDVAALPDERRAILHRYIEPTPEQREQGKKVPTKAHKAIAKLVESGHIRVIITTNFDRLMENALREVGIEPTVISSKDALLGAQPLVHSKCYLLKLHGDYLDARILNTDSELSVYVDEYNGLLDRILDEHGLIVCGWSGEWDHALRAAILRAPNRRYPMFWCSRDGLGVGAQELVSVRQAKVVSIRGADSFFDSLQQRIVTLEQSQLQDPLSVDLLVNTTKRYLVKDEYRIQLEEMLTHTFERLLVHLESPDFSVGAPWGQDELKIRVKRFEDISESLVRMVSVMGRWGDANSHELVLDILRGILHYTGKSIGGNSGWLSLRAYPAVLIFTAYGLALTRSQRFEVLHDLFCMSFKNEYKEPQRLVDGLYLWSWSGGKPEIWNMLETVKKKTPLSNHLLSVMRQWKSSFAGVTADFDLLYARFEMLAALAYIEPNSEGMLEVSAARPGNEMLAAMPVGQLGWNTALYTALELELNSEQTILDLINAGFGQKSKRFIELFKENMKRYSAYMQWH
ncbi:hypothetical protein DBR37_05790 [Herminiimonas sp. KBW02]|uniref:SIR2 family protein n=1 Tax=Herminiimonas sp. KBW02 TaxID=2153363 RepID=UPI000F5985BF|nr:SIR2 family protein [Herminiimonas sp. KBW02]RQO35870.1 hypothetical protein DBR37_05790 [Herminiimonas sp. KBW02]